MEQYHGFEWKTSVIAENCSTKLSNVSKEAVKGDGLFEAGSFILATTATIGEHAMLIADSLANQRFTNLNIRKSLISKLSRIIFFIIYL